MSRRMGSRVDSNPVPHHSQLFRDRILRGGIYGFGKIHCPQIGPLSFRGSLSNNFFHLNANQSTFVAQDRQQAVLPIYNLHYLGSIQDANSRLQRPVFQFKLQIVQVEGDDFSFFEPLSRLNGKPGFIKRALGFLPNNPRPMAAGEFTPEECASFNQQHLFACTGLAVG